MLRIVLLAVLVMVAAPALAQDPVKVAAKTYSVVLENDQVRVLKAVLAPGDKVPPHDHPATVVIPLNDSSGRFTSGGKSQDQKLTAGAALWIPAENHSVENTGKTKAEVIIVEIKARK